MYTNFKLDPRTRSEPSWISAFEQAVRNHSPAAFLWAWQIHVKGHQRKATGGRKPGWQILDALERTIDPEFGNYIPIARRWLKELHSTSEDFLCWMLPLVAHIFGHPAEEAEEAPPEFAEFDYRGQKPITLDKYVRDMHVAPADRMVAPPGGWKTLFAEEGSLVINESPLVDQTWKAFYMDCKRLDGGHQAAGPPARADAGLTDEDFEEIFDDIFASRTDSDDARIIKESEYKFLVRAQLNTAQRKTDVYFARHPDGRLVVVKGPFLTREPVDRALQMAQWKLSNNIPAMECWAEFLVPDRWPDGVPLGIRNLLGSRGAPAWFLVAASLVEETDISTRQHQSKLWPPTEVVDWGAPPISKYVWDPLGNWEAYSEREKDDYVLALLARYVIGISDLADRNFMRSGGRVYAFDEDSRVPSGGHVRIAHELRDRKSRTVREWFRSRHKSLADAVAQWKVPADAELRWNNATRRLRALNEDLGEPGWVALGDDLPF